MVTHSCIWLTARGNKMGVPSSVGACWPLFLSRHPPPSPTPSRTFYRGKQVQIYVGYGAGGGYDAYARLIARHLGRHIPGEPRVVVHNMPGAGSLRAANFIFNRAPNDGTALATFGRNMIMLGLFGAKRQRPIRSAPVYMVGLAVKRAG